MRSPGRLGYYPFNSFIAFLLFLFFIIIFFSMKKLQHGLINLLMNFKLFLLGVLRYGQQERAKYKISIHFNTVESLIPSDTLLIDHSLDFLVVNKRE